MTADLIKVAAGGAVGASLRYLANVGALRLAGPGFPVATLFVNVTGSFLIGASVVIFAHVGGARLAPLVVTGILGGFTTFSAFSLDTLVLFERGDAGLALLYVAGSVGLSLAAVALGLATARGLVA